MSLLVLCVVLAVALVGAIAHFTDQETDSANSFSTSWKHSGTRVHSGSWSALSEKGSNGRLTTGGLDASTATQIRVSFWYEADSLNLGDIIVQLYNPSTLQYVDWYDILNYPSYQVDTWCYFDEYVTDSQYFISNFRLRFDAQNMPDGNDEFRLDDVYTSC